jgi:septum formation protein
VVEMMALSMAQIDAYIATGEHRDKAGSYGIQGAAGAWIKRIEGSYTGVMGLPLYETADLLRKHGVSTY